MTLDQFAGAGSALGVMGLLFASLYGLYKQWWVPGWSYRIVIADRDEWKNLALQGLRNNADLIQAAKQHTTFTPEEAEMALQIVREAGKTRPK